VIRLLVAAALVALGAVGTATGWARDPGTVTVTRKVYTGKLAPANKTHLAILSRDWVVDDALNNGAGLAVPPRVNSVVARGNRAVTQMTVTPQQEYSRQPGPAFVVSLFLKRGWFVSGWCRRDTGECVDRH